MFIHEAVKEAMKQGGRIQRRIFIAENGWQDMRILPTNTRDCCIPSLWENGNEVSHSRCWNPSADDLVADDWQLAD